MLVNLDEKMLCEYKGSILLNEFYSEEDKQKSLIEKLELIVKKDILYLTMKKVKMMLLKSQIYSIITG